MPKILALLGLIAVVLLSERAVAQTITVPAEVVAKADGSFQFDAVFDAGPSAVFLASYGYRGVQNVSGGLIADCFCGPGCQLPANTRRTFSLRGRLDDPRATGVVRTTVSLCGGANLAPVLTTVLPDPSTAPAVPALGAPGAVLLGLSLLGAALRRRRAQK